VILGFVLYAFYQRNTNVQQNFLSVPQDSTSKTQLAVEQPLKTIDTTTSTSNPPPEAPESISINEDDDEGEYEDEEGYYANQSLTTDTSTTTTAPASTSTTTTTTSAAPAETTTTTVNAAGLYKDGQYDGNVADAYWLYRKPGWI